MPRGTGHVYRKRGREIWYIQYGHNGKVYYESSRSRRKKDAVALLKKRLAEISSGRHAPNAERVTFDQLAAAIERDYRINGRRSLRRLKTSIKQLRDFFGGDRARDITTERINRYVDRRQQDGRANSTIQNELSALKRMFTLAVQSGVLNVAPYVPSLRINNARQGFFTDGDLAKVLDELPPYLRAPTRFAYLTGWRKEEVLSREWSHVDFENGEVRLWESKNDEPRVFPFAVLPALKTLLEEQRERTRAIEKSRRVIVPWVFHRDGEPIRSMKNAWNGACERAGLDGWLFHDLRRSAVRNLEAAGVPRSVAMKLTGHKTEAVYRRYAIADAAALREGVAKLARLHELPAEPSKVVAIGSRTS